MTTITFSNIRVDHLARLGCTVVDKNEIIGFVLQAGEVAHPEEWVQGSCAVQLGKGTSTVSLSMPELVGDIVTLHIVMYTPKTHMCLGYQPVGWWAGVLNEQLTDQDVEGTQLESTSSVFKGSHSPLETLKQFGEVSAETIRLTAPDWSALYPFDNPRCGVGHISFEMHGSAPARLQVFPLAKFRKHAQRIQRLNEQVVTKYEGAFRSPRKRWSREYQISVNGTGNGSFLGLDNTRKRAQVRFTQEHLLSLLYTVCDIYSYGLHEQLQTPDFVSRVYKRVLCFPANAMAPYATDRDVFGNPSECFQDLITTLELMRDAGVDMCHARADCEDYVDVITHLHQAFCAPHTDETLKRVAEMVSVYEAVHLVCATNAASANHWNPHDDGGYETHSLACLIHKDTLRALTQQESREDTPDSVIVCEGTALVNYSPKSGHTGINHLHHQLVCEMKKLGAEVVECSWISGLDFYKFAVALCVSGVEYRLWERGNDRLLGCPFDQFVQAPIKSCELEKVVEAKPKQLHAERVHYNMWSPVLKVKASAQVPKNSAACVRRAPHNKSQKPSSLFGIVRGLSAKHSNANVRTLQPWSNFVINVLYNN